MSVARSDFAAARLPNGKVLVASTGRAELFDPTTGAFSNAGSMTGGGTGLTATGLVNGKVLLVGGQSFFSSANTAAIFDPAVGSFTPTGSMSVARSFHTATLLQDGRVLVTGGHQGNFRNSALASAEIYDPLTGSFTPTGSMNVPRQDHQATLLLDGRVLVTGGYNAGDPALASAELFDPITGIFTPTSSMAFWRGDHSATLLSDGKVLIAGGHSAFPGESWTSAELYDPASESFDPAGNMTVARGAHSASLLPDGRVLIAGGFTAFPFTGTTLSSAELYDPAAGVFTPDASMHEARGRHVAVVLDSGDVLVAGGQGQCCGSLSSAEVFSLDLVDTAAPVLSLPGDLTVFATDDEGAVVEFQVLATDDVDTDPVVSCEPPSGSTFPLGETDVVCTATDAAGNSSSGNFRVTVLEPFDLALTLDAFVSADPNSGVATVTGSIACNDSAGVFVSGELSQVIAQRATITGTFSAFVSCAPPSTPWSAVVVAGNGRFRPGMATLSSFASGCGLTCDFDEQSAVVTLRAKNK